MAAIALTVTGMTCDHCVATVTKALERVPGVESAKVSLEERRAVVTGPADPRALIGAIKDEGYEAALQT
jgi:copper chaperone